MRKQATCITYDSHIEFLNFVMDLHQQNPQAVRLDLITVTHPLVSNRRVAARFWYPENTEDQQYRAQWIEWRVNYDTMLAPLIEAQKLIDQGIKFPFESGETDTSEGIKLKVIGYGRNSDLHIYKME